MSPATPSLQASNALRYDPARASVGHVESYFWRANHPTRPLAVWLKATVLAPRRQPAAVAQLWCIVFDGEKRRVWAAKDTVPMGRTSFTAAGIDIAGARLELGRGAKLKGQLGGPDGECCWDLTTEVGVGGLGAPLSMFHFDRMIDGPFPKSKLLTPMPLLYVNGTLDVWGERFELRRWVGMQGHNWGAAHAHTYAWGQCHFDDSEGDPFCSVEAFSARIVMAGQLTPIISALVIRRLDQTYRFDHLWDLWRQDAVITEWGWRLKVRGAAGEALLEMEGEPKLMACLGYQNPDGRLSYCLNSKLARVRLRVNPTNAPGFSCESEHGGALEFLRNDSPAVFERIV